MKKIITLLAILLFLGSNLNAQNFAPLNAKWYFQDYSINSNELVSFYKASVDRDTIIENRYTTILSLTIDSISISQADILINEQGNKVYFYEDGVFKLLFDFNLNVGDTLVFNFPKNCQYYDITCGYIPKDSITQFSKVRIDSISQEIIGSEYLDVFHTSIVESSTNEYSNWHLNQIIERIGSLNGIFGHSAMQCLGGNWGHFRCYSDSLITYQAAIEDCDYSTSINDIKLQQTEIVLYPNPATKSISFRSHFQENFEMKIYNHIGQCVFSNLIESKDKNEIQTIEINLQNGYYIASFNSKGKSQRLIFQVIN
jgi:hypothetical protein